MTEKIELTVVNRPVPEFVAEEIKNLTHSNEYNAIEAFKNKGVTETFKWLYDNSRHKYGNKAVLELMSLLTLGYKAEEELYYLVVNNLYVNFDTKEAELSFEDNTEYRRWKTKFTLKQIKENPLLRPFEMFKVPVNEH